MVGDIIVPLTRVTVEVPAHVVYLGEAMCTLSNEVYAPVLVIRININEVDGLIAYKEGEHHHITIVD